MKGRESKTSQPYQLKLFVWGLSVGWTLVVFSLVLFMMYHERMQSLEIARTQARSNYQRDVIYRHWVAGYGAIYVPVTREIKPSPYLADIPERDITTPSGRNLTMVNPAYMSRLVFEMAAKEYEISGRVTSLKPIRPENRPDPWETRALGELELGKEEVSSREQLNGSDHLRLMRPLKVEQECMQCHGKHGYKVGQIRGGISVAVPMEPLRSITDRNILLSSLSFSFLWLAGLGGIFMGSSSLRRVIEERDKAAQEIVALNRGLTAKTVELETANRELDAFCATVSHDLRSPITAIGGFSQLIQELPADKHLESCADYTKIIYNEAMRMENLIETLLDFSRLAQKELRLEKVNMSLLALEISSELLSKEPERRVSFKIEENMIVQGDSSLLRVVLQNLLGNSWKYTSKRVEALIECGFIEQNDETVYFVSDNGIGFEMSQADRLFEPFLRLPGASDFKGSGVGLATVKRIIERHGGRVWGEGEVGVGAKIYFTL